MDWSIHVSSESDVNGDLRGLENSRFECGSKLAPVVDLTLRLIERRDRMSESERARAEQHLAVLEVSDSGIGIPSDSRDK